jgi:diguanylate cyclase (GGDEF)-like protein
VIGTPVQIGRKTHFLVFGSRQAMDDAPFAEDDIAFVDVLAAFVAHRFSEAEQRERIQFQMEHDALTGMKNRTQFRLALRAEIAEGIPFALAYLDLDRFRGINEMAGNMIGDELLVEVGAGLGGIDPQDFVARTSGDGFAIILRGVASAHDAHVRLAPYVELFAHPFHTGDRDGTRVVSLTASFGVSRFPDDGRTVDDLLCSADVALDVAKERGGACVAYFDSGMSAHLEQRYLQTTELSDAIEQNQLTLHYQPTFALNTVGITGAEALVRWNHPTRGLLSPAEFVPFAERNGLIGRLTRWVFERTVTDLLRLPAIPDGFRCYFNLSTQQLDDLGFINEIEQRLRFLPRIACHLGVEITETAAITNTESSKFALERFRKLGLRIAIDDFGTGYSSLSYLKRLPIDVIKIDRSFVTGLPDDQRDADLCELLLQVTTRFGLVALAEGIESFAQLQWLRDHGCTYGQGYLIAKPLPFAEFAELLPRQTLPTRVVETCQPVRSQ